MQTYMTPRIAGAALALTLLATGAAEAQQRDTTAADAAITNDRVVLIIMSPTGVDTVEYARIVRDESGSEYIADRRLAEQGEAVGYQGIGRDTSAAEIRDIARERAEAGKPAVRGMVTVKQEPIPGMQGATPPFLEDSARVRMLIPTGTAVDTIDYVRRKSGNGYILEPLAKPSTKHEGRSKSDDGR